MGKKYKEDQQESNKMCNFVIKKRKGEKEDNKK